MADPKKNLRKRRAVSPRVVFAGLVASFALAGLVALWIYVRYVAYERVAARHVYESAAAIIRLDLEKVTTYDPFRRHLLPLVTRGGKDEGLKPRLERLRHHTRVELGVDIRELVYATGADLAHWSLAVGGVFPDSGVPRGLHNVLEEEGIESEIGVNQLSFSSGVQVTQSGDGVVVFASDPATLASAANAGNRQHQLRLSEQGPVAVALDANALAEGVRRALGRRLGLDLRGMRVTARLIAEKPMRCRLRVVRQSGRDPSGDLVKAVRRLTGIPASEIEVSESPDGAVQLAFPISSRHLDEAAGLLSQWLTRQLSLPAD